MCLPGGGAPLGERRDRRGKDSLALMPFDATTLGCLMHLAHNPAQAPVSAASALKQFADGKVPAGYALRTLPKAGVMNTLLAFMVTCCPRTGLPQDINRRVRLCRSFTSCCPGRMLQRTKAGLFQFNRCTVVLRQSATLLNFTWFAANKCCSSPCAASKRFGRRHLLCWLSGGSKGDRAGYWSSCSCHLRVIHIRCPLARP